MTNQTDFWVSCSLNDLKVRNEKSFCSVFLRKEVPIISTLKHVKKAMENIFNFESKKDFLCENQINSFYRANLKCFFTHSHHFCFYTDDVFAFEICQNWFSCKQVFCQLFCLLQSYWIIWNVWIIVKLRRLILINFCLKKVEGKKPMNWNFFFDF